MARIRFSCSGCARQVDVEASLSGQSIECPYCQRKLVVPNPETASSAFFDNLFGPDERLPSAPPSEAPLASAPLPAGAADVKPVFELPDDMRWSPPESTIGVRGGADVERSTASDSPAHSLASELQAPPLPANARDPFVDTPRVELSDVEGASFPCLDLFSEVPMPQAESSDAPLDRDIEADNLELAEPVIIVDDLLSDTTPIPTASIDVVNNELLSDDLPGFSVGLNETSADPLADQPDAPLRIEGISPNLDLKDSFAVRCPICESRISIPKSQAGEKVQCPDCYSQIDAVPFVERNRSDLWKYGSSIPFAGEGISSPDAHSGGDLFGEGELRLSEPIERQVEPSAPVPFDASADMLPPRALPPSEPKTPEIARWKLSRQEREEMARREKDERQSSSQYRPGKWAEVKPRPVVANKPNSDDAAQPSRAIDKEAATEPEDMGFDRFGMDLELMFRWVSGFFQGKEFWYRFAGCVVLVGLAWWCLSVVRDIMYGSEPVASQLVTLVGCALLGGIFWVASFALLGLTCSQVFEKAVEKRSQFDSDPGWAWQDWGAGFLYLLVCLFVGGLPGAIVGTFLALAFESLLALQILWSLSAMVVAPVILASAYYNGSPYLIVAPAVLKNLRGDNLDWLRYLPAALGCWLAWIASLLLADIGGVLFSMLGALVGVVAWIAYIAWIGLYCALLVEKTGEQR